MTPDADTVVIHRICLDRPPAAPILDDDERQRAERFVFDRDRHRFIAAHTAVRAVLGRCLEMDPSGVRFDTGRHGKPRLHDPAIDVRFNLSHSGERALLAVALGREVGVDIEVTHTITDLDGTAGHVFSPAELDRLRRTAIDERHEVFFRIWTRKESFVKALGDGMHFPLSGFDVSAEATGPQLLLTCAALPQQMQRWTSVALPCEPGYTAALTVEGRGFEVMAVEAP